LGAEDEAVERQGREQHGEEGEQRVEGDASRDEIDPVRRGLFDEAHEPSFPPRGRRAHGPQSLGRLSARVQALARARARSRARAGVSLPAPWASTRGSFASALRSGTKRTPGVRRPRRQAGTRATPTPAAARCTREATWLAWAATRRAAPSSRASASMSAPRLEPRRGEGRSRGSPKTLEGRSAR